MSDIMIKDLAGTVGITAERLVDQLNEAGIEVFKPDDLITEKQKQTLLSFLQDRHGNSTDNTISAPKKITLKRKSVSEINLDGGARRCGGKSVSVEVRKKRTYIKRSVSEESEVLFSALQSQKEQKKSDSQAAADKSLEQKRITQAKDKHEANVIALALKSEKISAEKYRLAAEKKALANQVKQERARKMAIRDDKPAEKQLSASQITHKNLEEADARRRAANLAKIDAEKSLKARKKRHEENALKEKRAKAQALIDKHVKNKKIAHRSKEDIVPSLSTAMLNDKSSRRISGRRDDKFERKKLHVSKGKSGRRKKKKGVLRHATAQISTSTKHGFSMPTAPVIHEVDVPKTISVSDLALRMSIKAAEVIKIMMRLGTMVTINQILDQDTAIIIIEEMGHIAKSIQDNEIELSLEASSSKISTLSARAPVVTVMGHVDHGKTSLLDYIRCTKVASLESGGITQHIGAYKVMTSRGNITFLDTPGHSAFTEMRLRGAKVTDIVVLVIAADDGVMPQTIEAVQHSKATNSVLIVAINKMDKDSANPNRIKQDLANHEVVSDDWGGDVQFVQVSALTGQGIDDLLDAILLQAEIMELSAPVEGAAKGVVIEARLDRGRGTVITVLVQSGTLRKSNIVVVGKEYGRVRALFNEQGEEMLEAGPSISVEVLGLSGIPSAGDGLQVVTDERKAREIANFRLAKARELKMAQQQSVKLDDMFIKMSSSEVKALNIVVKADVHGSAEAVSQGLIKLSTDQVKVMVITSGVGGINATDASQAAASNAILIGFNVRADNAARKIIAKKGLEVQYFSIIYNLLDVVTNAITGMLEPVYKENIIGLARVDDVFSSPKFGAIAGCLVTEGSIKCNDTIRVLRNDVVIYEGELESLRRFKDDVNEVKSGVECGIGVKNYIDVRTGDQIEVYERVLMKQTL